MKISNNTIAPRWQIARDNAFLAALHVLVLVVSLVVHPPLNTTADQALP